jgi:hypothetical protein
MTEEQIEEMEALKRDRQTLSTMLEDVCDWLKTGQQMGSTSKVCRFCDAPIYNWYPHEKECPVTLFKEWKDGQ